MLGSAAGGLALAAALAATALAGSGALTLGAATSSKLGERVVVNPQGRTLYALSSESALHLRCKSSECTHVWPPLTVHSHSAKLQAASGIQGHLGLVRRSATVWQVTLRGMPVYRYFEDHASGDVNGQGIKALGGTWHAVSAASGASSPAPPPMTPTTPSPIPGY